MENTTDKFLNRYVFSEELPLEHKIFNLVMFFGIIAEIAAIIINIIAGVSVMAIFGVTGMLIITAITFGICIRMKLSRSIILIVLIFICDILFPLIFFAKGGINGGVTGFFVLCIILNFLLLRGKLCLILVLVHTAVMIGCYLLSRYFPSLVIPLSNESSRYIDVIHAIVLAGFLSGFLIKFQIRIYEREREKAEAATRAKADFLANISHEIRTPLNAIIGLGELELGKTLPPDTVANLEKIHNSGMSLLHIINDLLDISKIESGRFELITDTYYTSSLINDTANLNIIRIGSKPITFQLDIDEKLPRNLFGDELRIRQILNNLLSNAFKYTREGLVWLKIRSVPIQSEKDLGRINLVCTIEDTGMGIREDDLKKLFSAYNQVDVKSNRHIEGTGLGLSICKNLVELMGGTITVRSEYGKGSAFTVSIPQAVSDSAPLGSEMAKNLASFRYNAEKKEWRNFIRNPMPYAKVLVVDDVSTNLDVAKGMLMLYGMSIECASSGKEAIRKVREERVKYDAIFMDHMMPEMDGIEAVRIIRNEITSDYAHNVPIIALTANAIIGNEKLFLENGFNDFLSKPIDMTKLDVLMQKWVRNREKEGSSEWAPVVEKLRQDGTREAIEAEKQEQKKSDVSPIAGIDYKEGVKRLGNKEASYLRVLSSYAAGMPALLDKIRYFMPSALDDYRIIVHGIKGSSYGICANEIGKQAEALEMAARSGDIETILAKNDGFILQMEKQIGEITKYVTSL